jgi:phosphoribosylanthranilate isomerase
VSKRGAVGRVKVKICGLTRPRDVAFAQRAGADYLGVVLVPGTPRFVEVEAAARLLGEAEVPAVIVVADLSSSEVTAAAERVGAAVVQLHGNEPPEVALRVAQAGPWRVWKALRVREPRDATEGIERYGESVDGILLDGWHPTRLGGSGTVFSWEEVAVSRRSFPGHLEFVAAGGLNAENVREAVERLQPNVVDVSSGVEMAPGIKDDARITEFMRQVGLAGGESGV